MLFDKQKNNLLSIIQNSEEYKNDEALKRISNILVETDTIYKLKRKKSLINRITIDCVLNMKIGEKILKFTNNFS